MKNKSKKNTESDDELLPVAFDENEVINLPDEYEIDEINEKSLEFLKKVKVERKNLESKNSNFKAIEMEISLNVNNDIIFQDVYEKLSIDKDWIIEIKKEFFNLQTDLSRYKMKNHKGSDMFKNVGEIIQTHNLYYENIKKFCIPDENILQELCPKLTNKLCIKLISHFNKVLSQVSENEEKIFYWLYYILAMLQLPLVDEDNSILYSLNKKLIKILTDSKEETISNKYIGMRIIFVIISENFGQKVTIT